MPEGHKTHYLAKVHHDCLSGGPLKVTSPQGRFRSDARKVSNRVLDQVEAYGKHLFYHFEGDRIVHVHLGRYGSFNSLPSPPPSPIGQVRMRLQGERETIDLRGPTACRVIGPDEKQAILDRLGPDPLSGARQAEVWSEIQDRRKPIGTLLLDQSVIAGVGNIFRAEILFEIGMSPHRLGSELDRKAFGELWRSTVAMMKKGLKYGKIISVTAKEAGQPLSQLEGNDRFRVYGHKMCSRCDSPISTPDVGSRRIYYCERCQTR
ncbi:MAG: DNA-formamidopyrimidine glycosylase family protein [Planctomycetota bacterium]